MFLATDTVPRRGVAISSETVRAPRAACFAICARSWFVNLLFARCDVDAALAPMTTRLATIKAPSPAKRLPLRRDGMLSLPFVFRTANAPPRPAENQPER